MKLLDKTNATPVSNAKPSAKTLTFEKTTESITVRVCPEFMEDHSQPENSHFFWAYHVTIENKSNKTVQLLTRHWRISDAKGLIQDVKGDGIVGNQPVLKPGERFQYSSGAPLKTPSGMMFGSYGVIESEGTSFNVEIPAFSLDSPYRNTSVH